MAILHAPIKICDQTHPHYASCVAVWDKWRLVYSGGEDFLENYLEKFSGRETDVDFDERKKVTPVPAFAKAAVNDIKNSIYQRLIDISRSDGSIEYKMAVAGNNGGVDNQGATMTGFIGRYVLPELLPMQRVGVYVDMPPLDGETLADIKGKHPYLYVYRTEDIRSWATKPYSNSEELRSVLLRDWIYAYNHITGLPIETIERYRHLWINEETGFVMIQFYNSEGDPIYPDNTPNPLAVPTQLNITRIPFVIFQISSSLLADVANHQIALMNMESSDVAFILKANIPFYTEQQDGRYMPDYLKSASHPGKTGEDGVDNSAANKEITVGATQGRLYQKGVDRPDFIAPPTENLNASMAKQERLKNDIRTLINLALSNIQPRMASAESKVLDERGLEAGLSYIGLELEHGENKIAEIWAEYEGLTTAATIKYPERYSLQSDEDRRRDAEAVDKLRDAVPSRTFSKQMARKMVNILLGSKVTEEMLQTIYREIDVAKGLTGDVEVVIQDHEAGLVSDATASILRGYDPAEVEQARKDKAERLKLIAISQSQGIRGATDDGNQQSKADKQINSDDPDRLPPRRGGADGSGQAEDT